MSGKLPRLLTNTVEAVAPNTLHLVHAVSLSKDAGDRLAVLWLNALTRPSTELEGHALGGGMLKLEPSEAKRVLVPDVELEDAHAFALELDALAREKGIRHASDVCTERVLRNRLGLSASDCQLLRQACDQLMQRRYRKQDKEA
jgi:hypothetical protein